MIQVTDWNTNVQSENQLSLSPVKINLMNEYRNTLQANAQVINLNPDPNSEPWWSGGSITR